MELASAAFRDAVSALLDGNASIVATVHVFPHPFTDALKRRPGVQMREVTRENRDALPARLVARISADASR
jgi:nucleoside-triphosphatase